MAENFHRTNVLIRHDQYERILKENLSLSGLIRDLLDDRFVNSRITLSVSRKTKKMYDYVISNFGTSDQDLEPYIIEALDKFLEQRMSDLKEIREKLNDLKS